MEYSLTNKYDDYNERDDSNAYLKKFIISIRPTASVQYEYANHIYVDLNIYKYINHKKLLRVDEDDNVLDDFNEYGYTGKIYCLRQIINLMNNHNIKILQKNDELFIAHDNKITELQYYVNNYIYNKSYDEMVKMMTYKYCEKINENAETLYLLFIGSLRSGQIMIDKLIKNNKHNDDTINHIFIFRNTVNIDDIKESIKSQFSSYAIYIVNECGTDIIPTMIVYDLIINEHKNKYEHIIKLQSKQTNDKLFNETIDYLLLLKFDAINLIMNIHKTSNCAGEPTYQRMFNNETFNLHLVNKFKHLRDDNMTHFCAGTMFYTKPAVMNKIAEHIKEPDNYKMYLLNNTYDNNTFFYKNSPVHFLERFFGNIKI